MEEKIEHENIITSVKTHISNLSNYDHMMEEKVDINIFGGDHMMHVNKLMRSLVELQANP